jgi:hypothetical protein
MGTRVGCRLAANEDGGFAQGETSSSEYSSCTQKEQGLEELRTKRSGLLGLHVERGCVQTSGQRFGSSCAQVGVGECMLVKSGSVCRLGSVCRSRLGVARRE